MVYFEVYVSKELLSRVGLVRSGRVPRLPLIDVAPLLDPDADHGPVAREIDAACREFGFFYVVGHGVAPTGPAPSSTPRPRLLRPARRREGRDRHGPRRAGVARLVPVRAASSRPGGPTARRASTSARSSPTTAVARGHAAARRQPVPRRAARAPRRRCSPGSTTHDRRSARRCCAAWRSASASSGAGSTSTSPPTRSCCSASSGTRQAARRTGASAEHTDYGLLTMLAQDGTRRARGARPTGWIDVPPIPGTLRVQPRRHARAHDRRPLPVDPAPGAQPRGAGPLSFPFFFDPAWDAEVCPVAARPTTPRRPQRARWDGSSVAAWSGTYGDYLTAKVGQGVPGAVSRRQLLRELSLTDHGRHRQAEALLDAVGQVLVSATFEIPGGSVDRMISSWACSISTSSMARTGLASPTMPSTAAPSRRGNRSIAVGHAACERSPWHHPAVTRSRARAAALPARAT